MSFTLAQALTFLFLGLGAGAAYAISAVGLVQIYRGSGVINFAHGALAYLSAALYAQFSTDWDWPWVPSFLLSLSAAVFGGVIIQLFVMRPLRNSSMLVRIIATVGVLAVIEQAIPLVLGNITQRAQVVKSFYPSGGVAIFDSLLTYDRIAMLTITVAIAFALSTVVQRTRFGLATTAVAEDPLVAEALGVRPERVALINWAIGGGLAGLTGLLMVPWTSLAPGTFILLIVPALVAALIGRFQHYGVTVVAGVAIGSLQSLLFLWQSDPEFPLANGYRAGWNEALPFLVMIAVLASSGSALPTRGETTAALPVVGRRSMSIPVLLLSILMVVAVSTVAGPDFSDAISSTAGFAVLGLSVVVVTGLAGQISLAQAAMAGVGALVAGRLSGELGWPFPVVVVCGVTAGVAIGLLFGLPALRTRGPMLAVVTVGLGVAIETTVFTNQGISGASFSGIPIERPEIFGWQMNAIEHPTRFAAVACIALLLCIYVVSNVRSGPLGRRFLAVRSNERAAAALGLSVQRIKLVAFAISSGLASIGGILIGFKFDNVNLRGDFGLTDSLLVVVFTLIGGVGTLLGPIVGAALTPSGLVAYLFDDVEAIERWLIIVAGVIVIVQLIAAPNGLVHSVAERFGRRRSALVRYEISTDMSVPEDPAVLKITDLSVSYGVVKAVDSLTVAVSPGQIVGLIGPNGAGKTSAVDAISGFTPNSSGSIRLGSTELSDLAPHHRSQLGLARTFQTVEPFEDLTVLENLAVATGAQGAFELARSLLYVPKLVLPANVGTVIEAFGLEDELHQFPSELPQGRRRLLGVARAMARNPRVLLLDEPAAGLDGPETAQLGVVLRRVATDLNVGMLLIEHDMSIVSEICDEVVALDFGQTIASGPSATVLTSAAVRAAYLGEPINQIETAEVLS